MAVKISIALRIARMTEVNTRAGNSAKIRIYTGAQPANADAAASGTLLGEVTGNAAGFGTIDGSGNLTANAMTEDSAADATGTAGWFRVLASDGVTVVFDGAVGAEMTLVTNSIVAGQPIRITSLGLTEGGA